MKYRQILNLHEKKDTLQKVKKIYMCHKTQK